MNRVSALLLASLLGAAACTAATQDNFTNPPPGPPSSCTQVSALAGCAQGSLSYSCTSSRPDDGDTELVCDDGVAGTGGATLYCCAPYGQWATECVPSVVPGCGAQSIGFSCSGGTSPDEADTSLVCSAAVRGDGGASDYCCVSFDTSSGICTGSATGCAGAAIGFTCAPGHAPSEVNPLLACSAPDGGGDLCCETP